jgi:endonuclease-3
VPRVSKKAIVERAVEVSRLLSTEYPGSAAELCALRHDGPFQLLAATILSAQCTDERVNIVTPVLFQRFPDPPALAVADPAEVEDIVKSTGFFRSKTQHLLGMSSALVERFVGRVPESMEDLTSLPGVGRKTANVVRSVALGLPGLPVDTHVGRLVRRLGLSRSTDPVKVETEVCAMLPAEEWGAMSLRLILHGRKVCQARNPRCGQCLLAAICPSAGTGGTVKPPVKRPRGAVVAKRLRDLPSA